MSLLDDLSQRDLYPEAGSASAPRASRSARAPTVSKKNRRSSDKKAQRSTARAMSPKPPGWRPGHFVTYDDLGHVIGACYSRVHINRLIKANRFPKPVHLSPGRIAWRLSDLQTWMESRR